MLQAANLSQGGISLFISIGSHRAYLQPVLVPFTNGLHYDRPLRAGEPEDLQTDGRSRQRIQPSPQSQIEKLAQISCLFVDIGGVLLTNGWDHLERQRVVEHFQIDLAEIEERHHIVFEIHEQGKMTFDEYLSLVVFDRPRPFTREQFRSFMCEQSKPFPEMIELVHSLKVRYGLKVVVVSNESRELNAYRIHTFKLDDIVDTFVSSCYVGLRKPDVNIFRLALDLVQASPTQSVFIDNTAMFCEIAKGIGIHSIWHENYNSTRAALAALGLPNQGAN